MDTGSKNRDTIIFPTWGFPVIDSVVDQQCLRFPVYAGQVSVFRVHIPVNFSALAEKEAEPQRDFKQKNFPRKFLNKKTKEHSEKKL